MKSSERERLRLLAGRVLALPEDRLAGFLQAARSDAPATRENGEPAKPSGGVQVINVFGEITPRPGDLDWLFGGGTTVEGLRAQLRKALDDPAVSAVVLNVDSPGGDVAGVPEMADEVFAARGRKPIVAVANTLMASAAYWIASQADQVVATRSAEVGGIGVYALHESLAGMLEQAGIEVTVVKSDENKAEGLPFFPLTDAAREELQRRVDQVATQFRADVARGRGVTAAVVRNTFGGGRTLPAKEAKAAGLVDRVATLDEVLAGLVSGRRPKARAAADEGAPGEMLASAEPPDPIGVLGQVLLTELAPVVEPEATAVDGRAAAADADYLELTALALRMRQ